ncbi:MAG TPA: hypothetical protein VIG48_12830 [Jatrophihabitans sp.]|jgi:hypothetical protein
MSQFSLFGAAVATPVLADLDGVLLAGGHWVRAGETARLSVVVAERWRAEALGEEFEQRAVAGDIVEAADGWSARTTFATALLPYAGRWSRGANEGPPAGFELTAAGLRLWTIASGRADEVGFLLGTGRTDTALHLAAGAQLSRLGLAAVSLSQRPGPGWRISSHKRVRRIAELVGPAPSGCGTDWPQAR